jgi:hypothetical protein
MSVLAGAIGAGVIMAAIGHEMSLAREADKLNEEREMGEQVARSRESMARESRLREMRDITDAQMQSRMMRAGMIPMRGRAARAVQMQELSRAGRVYGGY